MTLKYLNSKGEILDTIDLLHSTIQEILDFVGIEYNVLFSRRLNYFTFSTSTKEHIVMATSWLAKNRQGELEEITKKENLENPVITNLDCVGHCTYSRAMNQSLPRKCTKCRKEESVIKDFTVHTSNANIHLPNTNKDIIC